MISLALLLRASQQLREHGQQRGNLLHRPPAVLPRVAFRSTGATRHRLPRDLGSNRCTPCWYQRLVRGRPTSDVAVALVALDA